MRERETSTTIIEPPSNIRTRITHITQFSHSSIQSKAQHKPMSTIIIHSFPSPPSLPLASKSSHLPLSVLSPNPQLAQQCRSPFHLFSSQPHFAPNLKTPTMPFSAYACVQAQATVAKSRANSSSYIPSHLISASKTLATSYSHASTFNKASRHFQTTPASPLHPPSPFCKHFLRFNFSTAGPHRHIRSTLKKVKNHMQQNPSSPGPNLRGPSLSRGRKKKISTNLYST